MQIIGMVLGCLMLGQTADAVLSPPVGLEKGAPAALDPIRAGNDSNEAPTSLAVKAAPNRLHSPEMVADAMMLPSGSTITGQPWTLVSVLSSTPDRRQQLELTRTYWHLVETVADYHFCFDHVQQLERIKAASDASASVRLARASAAARLRTAELEATRSQCELARLARLPAGAALPLPADRPHVGSYRTSFQELFAGRTPPEQAVLMERILPIRRQSLEDQAAAVQAAEDALVAEQEPGRGNATAIIACSQELLQQQHAFIWTVCEYNRNIADYGLAVAAPMSTPQALVAILIGPAQQGVAPVVSGDQRSNSVMPTGATEPIANPMRQPSTNAATPAPSRNEWRTTEPTPVPSRDGVKRNEPTLAPRRDARSPNESTFAAPPNALRQASNEEPTLVPPRDRLQPIDQNEPPLTPAGDEAEADPVNIEDQPLVPVEPLTSSSLRETRTVHKPTVTADSSMSEGAGAAASPLYPALRDATPSARAKQLTGALHWDRSLPEGIGKSLSLADCLLRDGGGDRRGTIEAYWRLRQRAAEYQTLMQQSELLEGLVPVVLDRRQEPSGAADMLRLRSAQLAAQAATREAHVALVESQYALATRLGAINESPWPMASTVPHSGSYLLKLDAQPQSVVESWPVRRLTATVPALGASVQQHATAVVEADAARVAVAEQYRTGQAPIDQAIEGVTAQTHQTLALLETLTDYNRTIADYVLTVLPPATPATRLVAALVVKP